ncbi:MAG: hypothetical protein KC425_02800 [Anaerolineales bacterium]|nr:hypothetical protein [Anaerolineales bacterium]
MEEENYRAFLLRLWREARDAPWRASLEDPHTGQRHSFASDEQLLAFLRAQMAEPPGGPGAALEP